MQSAPDTVTGKFQLQSQTMQSKLSNLTVLVNVARQNAEANPQHALHALTQLVSLALDISRELRCPSQYNYVNTQQNTQALSYRPPAVAPLTTNKPACETDCDEAARIAAADVTAPVWYAQRGPDRKIEIITPAERDRHVFGWIKVRAHSREDAERIADAVL